MSEEDKEKLRKRNKLQSDAAIKRAREMQDLDRREGFNRPIDRGLSQAADSIKKKFKGDAFDE